MKTQRDETPVGQQLGYLKLPFMRGNYESFAQKAATKHWDHVLYLAELATAEVNLRRDHATERRIRQARLSQIKTIDQFKWSWPKSINRLQVQNVFRLNFIAGKSNIVFVGVWALARPIWPSPWDIRLASVAIMSCLQVQSMRSTT